MLDSFPDLKPNPRLRKWNRKEDEREKGRIHRQTPEVRELFKKEAPIDAENSPSV